jgi:hypothetical protein
MIRAVLSNPEFLWIGITVSKFVDVLRMERPLFGDDGRDVTGRRHIEGRVRHIHAIRGYLDLAENMGYLAVVALFYWDLIP